MANLKWFIKRGFVRLEEPNKELADSYIEKAETALEQITRSVSREWEAESAYYAIYHSVYSILIRIGIRCDKHAGTFEIMNDLLKNYFTKEEIKFILKAHNTRNDLQYYINRAVPQEIILRMKTEAPLWVVKCKSILASIRKKDIDEIQKNIKELLE